MSEGLEPPRRERYLDEGAATPMRRMAAHLVDVALLALSYLYWYMVFAYAAWWLIVLVRGQTPGKQILGLVAVKSDGTRFGWGRMFVREVFQRLFWGVSLGVGSILDAGMLMLSGDRRSVTDRVVGSTIVRVSTLQS